MPDLRRDPIVGRWVIIATERARRPSDLVRPQPPATPGLCPFCPGQEDKTPHEVRGRAAAFHPTEPAGLDGARRAEPVPGAQDRGRPRSRGGRIYDRMNGIGAHEVIIETPRHERQMKDLSDAELTESCFCSRRASSTSATTCASATSCSSRTRGSSPARRSITPTRSSSLPVVPRQVVEEIEGAKRHYVSTRSAASSATSPGRSGRSARGSSTRTTSSWCSRRGRRGAPSRPGSCRSGTSRTTRPSRRSGSRSARRRSGRRCAASQPRSGIPPSTSSSTRTRSATGLAFVPLAHRGHARAHPGGRVRVGLRVPHQPRAARRRRPSSSAGSRGSATATPGAAEPGEAAENAMEILRGVRGGALVEDGRPRGRRGSAPACARRPRSRGVGADATLRVDRSEAHRAGAAAPRARRARRGGDALDGRGARPGLLRRARALLRSRRGLYADGHDYADNPERFAYLCRAALPAALGLRPRVIHVNDWQTGLIPFLLRHEHARDPALAGARTVFTIHSLAYQGIFSKHVVPALGLPWDVPLRGDGVPRPANFLKRARLRRRAHDRLAVRARSRRRRAASGSRRCSATARAISTGS